MSVTTSPAFADQVLALMKSRRVCRSFTDELVSDKHLRMLTEAARWATSGGNRHLHKFLIVRNPETIRRVRSIAPGMTTQPPAMIVILTDLEVAARESLQLEHDRANWMDVGTAAMNMMNMAHALGIGTCPVTSFSQSGAAVMLDLPPHLIPEWILIAGHPKLQERVLRTGAPKPLRARDLTYWERVGEHEPQEG
jgi:nitroreductase